jgi:Mg-chelatase subunit ChlD
MRQLKYSFILLYLVFANLYAQNFDIINQNNIEVNKLEMGYHIYIQKNSETAGLKLKYKLEDGSYSYLYANNSLININNTSVHDNLGYVFETYLPETLHLYNNTQIKLRNNINLIFESYDIDGNILSESEIALKINNDRTNPIISLRNVEREGDLYAFYLYYSGANNGRYAFYVRDGKTNEAYKLIKTTYGNTINVDGSAIILEDTYNREIGKKLYIKAYFKEMPNDRYLSFNVFNNNRETFTYPIDYIIESTNKQIIDNTKIIEPMPKIDETPRKEEENIIELNTNEMIVHRNINNNIEREIEKKNSYNEEIDNTLKSINNVERIKNTSVQDDNDLKANIHKIIDKYNNGNPVDLIMLIDTTGSMKPYLRAIKSEIKTISKNIISKDENSRIGFMLYRDTKDKYLTKKIEFNNNIEEIERESKYFYADGGGDKAEPMYEAIQQALEKFEFQNENRVIVVITDAKPKVIGRANLELNTITAKRKNVNVEIISAKEMKEEDSDDYLYFLDF